MSYEEAKTLSAKASKVFQPRGPITVKELFAGRWDELTTIADAVNQPGLHVVIYGERGVGKTSLANVVRPTIHALDGNDEKGLPDRLVIKSIGSTGDTFSSLWDKLLSEISWPVDGTPMGVSAGRREEWVSTREAFALHDDLSVDTVRKVLEQLPGAVFIIDEFDRAARDTSKEFTDLIKTLSDLVVDCTVVLVGVAETIDNLIADHASISRTLVQVPLPRMKTEELRAILTNAETSLGVEFAVDAASLIVHVSQGLPHYTHLIGLHAVRAAALGRCSRQIEQTDVRAALEKAVKGAEQTVTDKHSTATHSSHKDALYRHVLLACAIAASRSHDALGYFNPSAVVQPLARILGREVTIATFTNHLSEFSQDKRGSVLEKDGQPWGYRYRFHDPLLVPYAFMNAVEGGLLTGEMLVEILNDNG